MKKRVGFWALAFLFAASSANTGSDQSVAHTFEYEQSFKCLADRSGHSFTLKKTNMLNPDQREMVLHSDSSDLKDRTVDCEIIDGIYFCDFSGYYGFEINTKIRWKNQDGSYDPSNVQVTGTWHRGISDSGERIFCHL